MPYLDQGEFYSEFGSYDVSITLPDNYIVGATGNLVNEDEIKRLNYLSEDSLWNQTPDSEGTGFPPSSTRMNPSAYRASANSFISVLPRT